jgi:hypothetical protein
MRRTTHAFGWAQYCAVGLLAATSGVRALIDTSESWVTVTNEAQLATALSGSATSPPATYIMVSEHLDLRHPAEPSNSTVHFMISPRLKSLWVCSLHSM